MLKIGLILLVFLLGTSLRAEYRVYQYLIIDLARGDETKQNSLVKTEEDKNDPNNSTFILSSFDPVTFSNYFGSSQNKKVVLLRTWLCVGDTSQKSYCPSPYQVALLNEDFTSENSEKKGDVPPESNSNKNSDLKNQ